MNGNRIWTKDLGVLDSGFYMVPDAQWEFASSPVIHDGKVVIQADVQKDSFVAAFDVATGKELWRTARQDVPTFSTPTIHQVGGKTQVLVNGWKHTGAYDFATGKEIWKLNGRRRHSRAGAGRRPRPRLHHECARTGVADLRHPRNGDRRHQPRRRRNDEREHRLERSRRRRLSDLARALRGFAVRLEEQRRLQRVRREDRRKLYTQRLGTGTTAFTASIIAADGKIYFTNEEGDVYVVKAGRTFELLSQNPLGGITMATPAVVGRDACTSGRVKRSSRLGKSQRS